MMFQSLLISIGITGWILRMFCVPFSGPKLKLVLFWNGTLIRLPTGFCASFASSSADISARAGANQLSAPQHRKRESASSLSPFSCGDYDVLASTISGGFQMPREYDAS